MKKLISLKKILNIFRVLKLIIMNQEIYIMKQLQIFQLAKIAFFAKKSAEKSQNCDVFKRKEVSFTLAFLPAPEYSRPAASVRARSGR